MPALPIIKESLSGEYDALDRDDDGDGGEEQQLPSSGTANTNYSRRRSFLLSLQTPVRLPVRYRKECATMLVLVAVATEFVGVSIGLPILVQFATSLGVHEQNVGLVFSVGAFAGLLSNFWLPAVSDNVGRKPVLIFSLFGSMISYSLQACSQSFQMLLLVIFLGNLFGGTQPVAVAYISDIFSPAQRPRLIGMVPAAASACYIIGPALGGLLSKMSGSFRVPLAAAACLVAVMLPVVKIFLPDPKILISEGEKTFLEKQQAKEHEKMRRSVVYVKGSSKEYVCNETTTLRSNADLLSRPIYQPLLDWRCHVCFFIQFFSIAAFSAFTTCVPLILEQPSFGLDSPEDAVLYTGLVIGTGAAFKSIGLMVMFDRIQKRIGLPRTITLGAALSFVGFIVLAFINSVVGMAIGFAFFSLGVSLLQPGIFSYVTVIAPQEYTARAIGVPNAAINLGEVIGPVASTNLLVAVGYSSLFKIFCGLQLVSLLVSLCFHLGVGAEEEGVSDFEMGGETTGDRRRYSQEEYEEFLGRFFVKLLKERNYNLADSNVQKAILEMGVRSYPFLRSTRRGNKADVKKLMDELSIPYVYDAAKERGEEDEGTPPPAFDRRAAFSSSRRRSVRASVMASTF